MVDTHIEEQYQYIVGLICQRRLKEAIAELKEFLVKVHEWELQSKLEEVETAYHYMLEYMKQGSADPDRTRMHYKLLTDSLAIADRALLAQLSMILGRIYFKTKEEVSANNQSQTLESLTLELEAFTENISLAGLIQSNDSAELKKLRQRHEEAQAVLFGLTWTNSSWSAEEEESAKKLLHSLLVPVNDICLFVSAITLSLMTCFDLRKVLTLFSAYQHSNNQVNQRALVGLAIIFHLYHRRVSFYPEVMARITLLNEDGKFADDLNRVQIQMLRARETEKIDKKMREEIIPEMIKSAHQQQLRINPDEHDEENDDFNPDWAKELENSPLADKLREMSELQMEGADVYMSTFAQLKNYPFFRQIANWFYPFDKQHSLVVDELGRPEDRSILELILDSAFFCDSDKYSLCFTLMHIPKTQRDGMVAQLSEQQLGEMMNEEHLSTIKKQAEKPEMITNQYLHNIYRFFKLFPRRHEFKDLFADTVKLNEYEGIKQILMVPHLQRNIGDYYFSKEYYAEAGKAYQQLLDIDTPSAEVYQRLGFCFQKQYNYASAIEAYQKADVLKADNIWTNRHLATCYRKLKVYEKAVEYYKKVEALQPENRTLLFNVASCLAELKRYDEALQYFFKLDFIEPDNARTWRAIAWCSFVQKKTEQATRYYDKILANHPQAADYLNAGHVVWCIGDAPRAIAYYAESCKLSGNKHFLFDSLEKDKEILIDNGIKEDDIALMYDLI